MSEQQGGHGDFQSLQYTRPFVREDGASKSLHFTLGELQSRMLTHQPWRLDVDYTRTMMGFLLFQPAPAHIGMIGLGGGSLAKVCHRHLLESHITVLEINPHVIALRHDFQIPDDDERLQVIAADGALYLRTEKPSFDVLLVDGFDHEGQPAALCSQRFYDNCLAGLKDGGVLAVNLHGDDSDYPVLVRRIGRSFGGHAFEIMAAEKSNCIVFARKGQALPLCGVNLLRSLNSLEAQARRELKAELARASWEMSHRMNQDAA